MLGSCVYIWEVKRILCRFNVLKPYMLKRVCFRGLAGLEGGEGVERWTYRRGCFLNSLCGSWFTGCRCQGSSPAFWMSRKEAGCDGVLSDVPNPWMVPLGAYFPVSFGVCAVLAGLAITCPGGWYKFCEVLGIIPGDLA